MLTIIELTNKLIRSNGSKGSKGSKGSTGFRVSVHVADLSAVKGIKGHISNYTGIDISYSDDLYKCINVSGKINHSKIFTAADTVKFNNFTAKELLELEQK
jgi:hypothetical protein